MTARNWAAFRQVLRSTSYGHNRDVNEFFKDVASGEESARASLRDLCLIQANDSINDAKMRVQIFRDLAQRAHLKPDVYGTPQNFYKESVDFHPQVFLYFSQDSAAVPEGRSHIEAEIHFRLMNETPATITEANATTLARNISREFVSSDRGFVFTKGKEIVTYKDPERGYHLQIYASSQTEGEGVIKKVLQVQNHSYDPERQNRNEPKKNSVNNPSGTDRVLGRSVPKRRWRPTANVRFRYATLQLCGLFRDQILVDTTGRYRDALVKH